ncbi:AsmA family protein [Sphingomonas sanxanigenens]|uniref:AsmA domain-containing protein n=1 Tax=Sphingomonas sanxanigenens DSM 19645 = NX02 TaxID=1123269 RepID=W0A8U1_9SPHN|nr:AsmA family protein [Sphingomonas sanxanigenens]AHE52763.1 hypothetical protein NX02_05115 [Sphingomonas sanxanigenens DSM 19645 = NX02]
MEATAPDVRRRNWRKIATCSAAVVAILLLIAFLALAMFPWGLLKGVAERRLSDRIGKPVTIGALSREGFFSFHPTLRLGDIRVPQPARVPRAAGLGDLARIGAVRMRVSIPALIMGGSAVETLELSGARIDLYRAADGWSNWSGAPDRRDGSASRSALRTLIVRDSRLRYHDDKQNRRFDAAVAVDGRGLRMSGTGAVHGHAVTVAARGAPILDHPDGKAWPFSAAIEGKAVGATLKGTMPAPLDVAHLRGHATGHAIDLEVLDAIIEAGLPATQPVTISADVVRDGRDWTITTLDGRIGRSDIAGHATVLKRNGRTRIDGVVRARRFDFDDLSSDEGRRAAAAKRRRFGERLIPDTAIDLARLARTDGKLSLHADRLLWPGSSPFRSLDLELMLDRSRLTLDPVRMGLDHGTLSGRLVVDQRQGGPVLAVDVRLADARLIDFVPDTGADGHLIGRIRLAGPGVTVRQAIGRSRGSVALVATDGTLPARTASLLGQDIVKGVTVDEGKQAVLRCLIIRLNVAGGVARPDPLLIDTSRALTRAGGSINLADERLMLELRGLPKARAFLRLQGAVPIRGTIKAPDVQIPAEAKSARGILKMIGRAIGGKDRELAQDADCAALTRATMR